MKTYAAQTAVPFGAVAFNKLAETLETVYNTVVTWNAHRVTRNSLANLSDTQLNDIGLTQKQALKFPLVGGQF